MSDVVLAGLTDARATNACSPIVEDERQWWVATDVTDYWVKLGALLHRFVPDLGSLLGLGPDEERLGPTLVPPGRYRRQSTAIAPPVDATTQVSVDDLRCDTVLVTPCAVTRTQAQLLLERCLSLAGRAVVWVVPADDGYPGLVPSLSGCLPPSLIPEPGPTSAERLLSTLASGYFPNVFSSTPWRQTVSAVDLQHVVDAIVEGMHFEPEVRTALRRELAQQTRTSARGVELEAFRCSAVLVWYKA